MQLLRLSSQENSVRFYICAVCAFLRVQLSPEIKKLRFFQIKLLTVWLILLIGVQCNPLKNYSFILLLCLASRLGSSGPFGNEKCHSFMRWQAIIQALSIKHQAVMDLPVSCEMKERHFFFFRSLGTEIKNLKSNLDRTILCLLC